MIKSVIASLVIVLVLSTSVSAQVGPTTVRKDPPAVTVINEDLPQDGKEKTLSAVSRLQAENLKLRAEIAQLKIDLMDREAQLASKVLSAQLAQLELQFRKELGCASTDKFDWPSLKCVKEKKDEPTKQGK